MVDFSFVIPKKTDPYPFTADQLAWLEKLESGEKAQGRGWLEADGRFCCLGVACDMFGLQKKKGDGAGMVYMQGDAEHSTFLPMALVYRLSLRGVGGSFDFPVRYDGIEYTALTGMNDAVESDLVTPRFTHKDIAAYMRHDPWNVFRGPGEVDPNGIPLS